MHAGKDLDERRFARAVVAEEAQHLAGIDFKRYFMQHIDRTERLAHVL
jgi:hypothetical protein